VGWLEPFNHTRFSFNTIFVADPFFSIWPGIACIMLILLNRFSHKRIFWWKFGLLLPFLYLCYCGVHKIKMDRDVKEIFTAQHIPQERYFTTPAAFNNWLWYVVAGNDSGYYVGFRSVYDSKKEINFHYFPKNDSLLKSPGNRDELATLIRFSQQFYTIEKWNDTLLLNDLRFGQINGWENPGGKFAFHYFLQYPDANKMVVQRGRFAEWNWEAFKKLLHRIKGN
jgi:inner membrane protein